MIILHIILALSSVLLAALNVLKPAANKLKVSYSLAAGTLTTGVLLIVLNNASIVRTCISGITFLATVSVLNEIARKKLSSDTMDI